MNCMLCQIEVASISDDGLCDDCRGKLQSSAEASFQLLSPVSAETHTDAAVKQNSDKAQETDAASEPLGIVVWSTGNDADGSGPLEYPVSSVLTPSRELLVIDDADCYRIHRFDLTGVYLGLLMEIPVGERPGEIEDPQGVCCDPSGRIMFADAANDRISIWSASGDFDTTVGRCGNGDAEFARPCDVTTDSDGFIYVADSINRRIQKLSPEGLFCFQSRLLQNDMELEEPTAIIIDQDSSIYVGDGRRNVVAHLSSDGKPLRLLPGKEHGPRFFDRPVDLRLNDAGILYVSDRNNSRIRRFDRNGSLLDEMVVCDTSAGFDGGDIAIVADGVVVPDGINNRVVCVRFPS